VRRGEDALPDISDINLLTSSVQHKITSSSSKLSMRRYSSGTFDGNDGDEPTAGRPMLEDEAVVDVIDTVDDWDAVEVHQQGYGGIHEFG
jgi:hypothetical protein